MALREYQVDAVSRVEGRLREGRKRVLLVAPTGSGKGTMAVEMLGAWAAKGQKSLFLVHRREILLDMMRRLGSLGLGVSLSCGELAQGDSSASIQLASVQTLAAREIRPEAQAIVWDEAHHVVASSYQAIQQSYRAAVHIGLTATPERADGSGLRDAFDAIVEAATVSELVRQGYLVPCDVLAPLPRDQSRTILSHHPSKAYIEYAKGLKAVIYCSTVLETKRCASELAPDVPSAVLLAEGQDRAELLRKFDTGELLVLANVYVLSEGVDVPSIEVIVLARGCQSSVFYLQAIGRAMRPCPGKTKALVLDLSGAAHRHGLPTDDRYYSLDGKPIRLKRGLPHIRQCLHCGAVERDGRAQCERCGKAYPPPKATPVRRKSVPLYLYDRPKVQNARRQHYLRLVEQARFKKYNPLWVDHVYKAVWGRWPEWREHMQ